MKLVVMFVACPVCKQRWNARDLDIRSGYTLKHCGVRMNYVSAPVETVDVKELV